MCVEVSSATFLASLLLALSLEGKAPPVPWKLTPLCGRDAAFAAAQRSVSHPPRPGGESWSEDVYPEMENGLLKKQAMCK